MLLSSQSLSLFSFIVLFGFSFEFSESYPENALDGIRRGKNSTEGLYPRDEDDDDLDDKRRKVLGVGDILLGAFSLDLKKIVNGAFSFVDEDIRKNVLQVILGSKPPTVQKETTESPTTPIAQKNLTGSGEIGIATSVNSGVRKNRRTPKPETIDVRTSAPAVTEVEDEDDEESED
ncbi:unnamed protein product [Allacma fusca]|uniref:Uncharacterized protein n=1 Tax=Allacma fusca TaxID=39272 RepID=A0A8J2KRQ5_9HEXA|nr:unnamed protein product [Allacma fusca]